MPKITSAIARGDVFWARLDPTVGSEIQKTRPVVVVPLSTSAPAIEFLNVGLKGGSVARCEHVRSIDKSRLAEKIGSMSETDMGKIEEGISRIIGLNR